MSLAAAGLCITSLWLIIYAVKYSFRWQKLLLPLSQRRRSIIEVTVKQLYIRVKTEALNAFQDELSSRLSPNKSRMLRQVLLRWYDLGIFIGFIGMLLGFCLLFLTVASLSSEILYAGQDRQSPSTITRRGLDYAGDTALSTTYASDTLRINPIIPGFNVPLSHLPLILLALTVSQIFHEAGHAVTAALHRIPILSCGIAVTFFFPSAFVTFPAARLEKLPPRERLHIASGGCFHNSILLCFLFFTAWLGASTLPTWILFQDISALGRVVVSVDYDSPLMTHLPVGTLIAKIDDLSMASVASDDPWGHYLLSPSLDFPQGWCMNQALLDKAFAPRCTSSRSRSCFVSKENATMQYELDPVHIFTSNMSRCDSSTACSSLASCVVPHRDEHLVRISVLRNHGAKSIGDIVVWKGPREEIWEQVQVSAVRSRLPLVFSKLSKLASTFLEYMKIVNLSLYVVNMIPITALDGHQSLVALLQYFCSQVTGDFENVDVEALNNARTRPEQRAYRAIPTVLNFLALLLIVLCGLLGIISWAMK